MRNGLLGEVLVVGHFDLLSDPLVSEGIDCGEASVYIPAHQLFDEVAGFSAHTIPHRILEAPFTFTNVINDLVF